MSLSSKQERARKVLYLNHVSFIGGAECSLLTVLGQSKRALHTPAVLCPSKGPLVERLNLLGVSHVPFDANVVLLNEAIDHFSSNLLRHPLQSIRYAYSFSRGQAALLKRLITERPTIVHANSWPMGQYCAIPVKMLGIPAVCHVRDVEPVGRGDLRMAGAAIRALKLYDRMVAISDASKKYLLDLGFAENKVVKIYNGVDLRIFDPGNQNGKAVRLELDISADTVIVSQFGQICDRKNQLGFLEAAKILLAGQSNAVFLVIGQEFNAHLPVTKQLESFIAENGLRDRVRLLGFRSDVQQVMSASDIIVSPSIREPFGRTLIEGMAMERPIVATRSGGHPEIVEEDVTGLLVSANDTPSLVAAIRQLIELPELRIKMGKAGRNRAEKLFSAEAHVANLDRLYKEVSKESRDFWAMDSVMKMEVEAEGCA